MRQQRATAAVRPLGTGKGGMRQQSSALSLSLSLFCLALSLSLSLSRVDQSLSLSLSLILLNVYGVCSFPTSVSVSSSLSLSLSPSPLTHSKRFLSLSLFFVSFLLPLFYSASHSSLKLILLPLFLTPCLPCSLISHLHFHSLLRSLLSPPPPRSDPLLPSLISSVCHSPLTPVSIATLRRGAQPAACKRQPQVGDAEGCAETEGDTADSARATLLACSLLSLFLAPVLPSPVSALDGAPFALSVCLSLLLLSLLPSISPGRPGRAGGRGSNPTATARPDAGHASAVRGADG